MTAASSGNEGEGKGGGEGEVARLRRVLRRVPVGKARAVREVAQKEFEADVRAYEALISRGNTMLGATGVGISLLVGLSKDVAVDTTLELALLVTALLAAVLGMLLVVLGLRIATGAPMMNSGNIVGVVLSATDAEEWAHDHDTSLALAYLTARTEIRDRHGRRARMFAGAQWLYLTFLASVCALGIAIPC